MARPRDRVTIEGDAGVFDRFTSVEISNDLTSPAEASFECGDDATWASMEDRIAPGTEYRVYCNQKLRLTGRVQVNDVPIDPQGGATVRFVVRTKLADAAYASALASLSVQNATLKDIVLRAYGPLGFKETDFVFKQDLARDLMTGRNSRGGDRRLDLEPLQLEQAKVNPPETIYDFVERHLLRFHLSHWDSPDGKIVVGAPNDQQRPLYDFRLRKGAAGRHNNLMSAHRMRDVSDAPTSITIFNTVGPLIARYRVASTARPSVADVNPQRFYRPVIIPDQSIQTRDQAVAKAQRELLNRSKKLDAWEVTTDGWSFWDGQALIPFGIDTVASLTIDVAGGSVGPYLVHQTRLRLTPDDGFTAALTLLRQGLWVL